ncbi:Adipocyte-related X-chromosome0 expressed sequence 2 [Vanrija pseudolonga]|uniref:Signal peptidase subunit 3 n=1 Tax=Vanrija pseudolonga TaxID=143232 RepID=A0AAF1BMK7_9TREE|nr:Adipocyte-related X-chromosome0 expressed sequence 2 [Vanrija pseudolonga]
MYSTLQRLNHFGSISTTFIVVLLSLISLASFLTQPVPEVGKIAVSDLIVQRGRLNRWAAREEDIASLRFSVKTDLTPLLTSYNTKQLYLYLTAAYVDHAGAAHEAVLWDRIITRADSTDFRAVGKGNTKPRVMRNPRLNVPESRSHYHWRNPSGSFRTVDNANITLHYSLMPYVGILTSGIAAEAQGSVDITYKKR